MDIFTEITKNVGNLISKLKRNNELTEKLNKKYNPTFVEIIEDLKKSENTVLLALLYDWYKKRNNIEELTSINTVSGGCGSPITSNYFDEIDEICDTILKNLSNPKNKAKKAAYYNDGHC